MNASTRSFSTSMSCASCLSKLQPILDNSPQVISWKANLDDPRKLLHIEAAAEVDSSDLMQLISQAGFEARELDAESTDARPVPKEAFRLATYWPLFLVVSYVIAMATFAESVQSQFDWTRWMSYFMGFFFLGFAFFKLLNVPKFADAFSTYDIVAKRSRIYALLYPGIELGLGLLFVTQTGLVVANVLTAVVMTVGLVGVIQAVFSGQKIQCACLGTAFDLPMSVVTIVENSIMLAMAIAMLI